MRQKILVLSLAAIMLLGLTVNGTSALYSDTETAQVSICTWYDDCTGYCAARVVEFEQGLKKDGVTPVDADRSDPEKALGEADGEFFSLGFGGWITLELCQFTGGTLTLIEITNGSYPIEMAEVLVSGNGIDWVLMEDNADNQEGMPESSSHPTEIYLGDTCCIRYVKITDKSDPSDHASNADAFDIDAICGEPCTVFDGSVNVVSDPATMIIEIDDTAITPQPAELVPANPDWDDIDYDFGGGQDDAHWIWNGGDTVRLLREFCIPCNPVGATLHITADACYTAWMNGYFIGNSEDWDTVEEYSIDPEWLWTGDNELEILATASPGSAGVIFELVVEYGDECEYCCDNY